MATGSTDFWLGGNNGDNKAMQKTGSMKRLISWLHGNK
jgi:hypothetical protein